MASRHPSRSSSRVAARRHAGQQDSGRRPALRRHRKRFNNAARLTAWLTAYHDPRPWALWSSNWSTVETVYYWSTTHGLALELPTDNIFDDYAALVAWLTYYGSTRGPALLFLGTVGDFSALCGVWQWDGTAAVPSGVISLVLPQIRHLTVEAVGAGGGEDVDVAGWSASFAVGDRLRLWDVSAAVEIDDLEVRTSVAVDGDTQRITLREIGGSEEVAVPAALAAGDICYQIRLADGTVRERPFTIGGVTRNIQPSANGIVTIPGTGLRTTVGPGLVAGCRIVCGASPRLLSAARCTWAHTEVTLDVDSAWLAGFATAGAGLAAHYLGGVYRQIPGYRHAAAVGSLTNPTITVNASSGPALDGYLYATMTPIGGARWAYGWGADTGLETHAYVSTGVAHNPPIGFAMMVKAPAGAGQTMLLTSVGCVS